MSNELRLDLRKLGNIWRISKLHRIIAKCLVPPSSPTPEMKILLALAKVS